LLVDGARQRAEGPGMPATGPGESEALSRIAGKRRPTSWAVGLPVAALILALIGLFTYFASKAENCSYQLDQARRELTQKRQTLAAAEGRLSRLEIDLQAARNPGRTTVALLPQDAEEARVAGGAWGSAVWGEVGGKGFVQLRAYGLRPPPQGKVYQAWLETSGGAPHLLGTLDPGPQGAAYVEGKGLAAPDLARRVFVTLGDEGATSAGGPTLFQASLAPGARAQGRRPPRLPR
jgi:hypothetical protein